MINVWKLVKGDEFVFVNADALDPQYIHWVEKGFAIEVEQSPKPADTKEPETADTKEPEKTEKTDNESVLTQEELLVLPKANLIALAKTKGIKVDEDQPKDKIVELLVSQS